MESENQTKNTEEKDYKKMTDELIQNNRLNFLVGGSITLAIFISLFFSYGIDFVGNIATNYSSAISSTSKKTKIENAYKNDSIDFDKLGINYIDPKKSESDKIIRIENEGIPMSSINSTGSIQKPIENGQISAIQSGQVTYKQNKYVIQPGESLADIAQKVYGDKNAWPRIANANGITNPDHIEVGMELVIPR